MTIIRTICAGIIAFALSATATNAQSLLNGGFEIAGGIYTDTANSAIVTIGATNWVQFNNALRTAATNEPVSTARSGSWSLKCFGDTSWIGEGTYQRVLGVTPGQQWVLNAYGLTPSSDALTNIAGGSPQMPFGLLQLTYQSVTVNAGTNVYASLTTFAPPNIYGTNPPSGPSLLDTWQFRSVTGTAPAGAGAIVVYAMELGYGAGSQGSIFFDDLSLVNLNAPIVTNSYHGTIAKGIQVCWVADTNSTYQAQASVDNSNWVNLGQQMQGDGNTDCVFDTSSANKFYRVLQLQ